MTDKVLNEQEDVGADDRRRAKLVDLQRMETALSRAEGCLNEVRDALREKKEGRASRAEFFFHGYMALMANDPRGFKSFRAWMAEAWSRYNDDMDGLPLVGLVGEQSYVPRVEAKHAAILGQPGNDAASGVFTTKVFAVKAEPAKV